MGFLLQSPRHAVRWVVALIRVMAEGNPHAVALPSPAAVRAWSLVITLGVGVIGTEGFVS